MLGFLGLVDARRAVRRRPRGAAAGRRASTCAAGCPSPTSLAHSRTCADANRPVGRDLVCFAGGGAYDHEIPAVVRALAVALGVRDLLHPLPARGGPGRPAGDLRVPDHGRPAGRAAGRQRLALRRGSGAGRGGEPRGGGHRAPERVGARRGSTRTGARCWRPSPRGTGPPRSTRCRWSTATPPGPSRRAEAAASPGWWWSAYPNYLGCLEDLAAARAVCDRTGALLVVAFDPVAAGLLRSPGDWGADVVVGEGQPFGTPLGFGGPYLGLFACTLAHVRRLPAGWSARRSTPRDGAAYVTTLRAREQDIRREKATSNVCTNQTLMARDRGGPARLAGHLRAAPRWPCAVPGRPATAARRLLGHRRGGAARRRRRSSASSPSGCPLAAPVT